MIYRIAARAGNGTPGYGGDGGPAESALLNWPRDIALDAAGVLYIADTLNHRIRRIDPNGVIATVAGIGSSGHSGDGGPASLARLAAPRGVAVAADGGLYVSDTENHCIRRISLDGRIQTVAGTGEPGHGGDDGPAAEARLSWPAGMAVGADGSVYVADSGNDRIRQIGPDGRIDTMSGTGDAGYNGDDRPAACAWLSCPRGVALGPDGSLYVGDTENHRVRRITPEGMIYTAAGTGDQGYSGDGGPATAARLSAPRGVAMNSAGGLFIADCDNSVIRLVHPDGMITTIAGNGIEGHSGDGGPATEAQLADPHGLVLGDDGALYTAEPRSSCVRKLWPAERGDLVRVHSQ
jgi:sugar lactone lactonase YvrE